MKDSHAVIFIKGREEELKKSKGDGFETVTVRLETKYTLMLKELAKLYKFPISTSFTDITSMHLVDILAGVSDEDFKELVAPYEKRSGDSGSAPHLLRQKRVLEELKTGFLLTIPEFLKTEKDGDTGVEADE